MSLASTPRREGRTGAPRLPGTGCCSPPASGRVARRVDTHHAGGLQAELVRLGRQPLLVVAEVGCIPFKTEAANLFFELVSSRYERASLIVTSNKNFHCPARRPRQTLCSCMREVPEHLPRTALRRWVLIHIGSHAQALMLVLPPPVR